MNKVLKTYEIFENLPFQSFYKDSVLLNDQTQIGELDLIFRINIPLRKFDFIDDFYTCNLSCYGLNNSSQVVIRFECDNMSAVDIKILKLKRDLELYDLNDFILLSKFFFYSVLVSNQQFTFEEECHLVSELVNIWESRNVFEYAHSSRVAFYSKKFAGAIGMSPSDQNEIYWAAFAHDLGKIFVPKKILNKSGELSQEEREQLKNHTYLIDCIFDAFDNFNALLPSIKHHHERWDGYGYPDHLSREEIPLYSRIINIADSYDAMINFRVYKNALSSSLATKEIEKGAGYQFDPDLAKEFIKFQRRL
jgi:HD-GYP domain-containing protein (c-di-GMP phosphodiesterase class II)